MQQQPLTDAASGAPSLNQHDWTHLSSRGAAAGLLAAGPLATRLLAFEDGAPLGAPAGGSAAAGAGGLQPRQPAAAREAPACQSSRLETSRRGLGKQSRKRRGQVAS